MIPASVGSMVGGSILRRLFKWIFRHFVASFFLFFAIGLLIYGVQGIHESAQFLKQAVHVPATILSSDYDFTKKRMAVVAELDLESGQKKQFSTLVDGQAADFVPGSIQEAYYTVNAPDDIRFGQGSYKSHIVKIILAVIFGVVGLVLVAQDNKKRAAKKPSVPTV